MIRNALLDDYSITTYINNNITEKFKVSGEEQKVDVKVLKQWVEWFETMHVKFFDQSPSTAKSTLKWKHTLQT